MQDAHRSALHTIASVSGRSETMSAIARLRGFLVDAAHEDLPEDVVRRLNQTVEELDP